MTDGYAIARATPIDLEPLLEMVRAYYAFDGIAFDRERVRRGVEELVGNRALGDAWLIRRGGSLVGYFVLTYGFDLELGGRQATVTELYVRDGARGRGAGRAALAHVEAHLRALGIGAYELQVERDNAEARAFYARMGFAAHDRIPLTKSIRVRRDPMFATAALARRIDAAEAALTEEIGRARGALVSELGGGVGVFIGDSPFDKVIGVGFAAIETAALAAHEARVAARGGRVQVELSTLADPAVGSLLSARGYALCGFENVFGCALDGAPRARHEVARVAPSEEEAWLAAVAAASVDADDSDGPEAHEAFTHEAIASALRDLAAASGQQRFVVRIDGEIAGGASMRIHDGIAQLGGAATVARFRRRGVQTALLAARLSAAAAAGCELAVVTTQPGSRSQQNVMRAGFSLLYARAILRR